MNPKWENREKFNEEDNKIILIRTACNQLIRKEEPRNLNALGRMQPGPRTIIPSGTFLGAGSIIENYPAYHADRSNACRCLLSGGSETILSGRRIHFITNNESVITVSDLQLSSELTEDYGRSSRAVMFSNKSSKNWI